MKKVLMLFSSIVIVSIFSSFLLVSWKNNQVSTVEQYNEWLNNEKHNCLLTKRIGGVRLSVKYQPPLYIALKEVANNTMPSQGNTKTLNNLLSQQEKVMTFMMTLGPDKDLPEQRRASALMSEGSGGYAQFNERVMSANFFMDQYISLYVDGVEHKAALCVLENLYELAEERTFMIVFAPSDKKALTDGKEFMFEYNDPYFNIGKVQFNFSSSDLKKARQIKVVKG